MGKQSKEDVKEMEMESFYQVCVYLSVALMVFTLSINFTAGLGVFGDISPSGGMDVSGNSSDIVGNFTKNPSSEGGFGNIWLLVFGAGTAIAGLGALAIAIATQNATFVGVYVFSVYFWASYINALSIISLGGFLPASFILLFTIPIGFVFIGAVVGMLSGV
jgi:hypothetical protein